MSFIFNMLVHAKAGTDREGFKALVLNFENTWELNRQAVHFGGVVVMTRGR